MPHQICLEWNNHKTLLNELKRFLILETMIDVTLACDGKTLKAHKLILSACSPFFQSMFIDNPCQHPIVILPNVKYEYLEAVIHFIYHGEVNVSEDQLEGVFETADILRVKVLGEVMGLNNPSGDESEPQSRDESEKQFVDDSENLSGDASVYQSESATCGTSSEQKLNFSLNSVEQKSVEKSVASEVDVVDSTSNTVIEISTTNDQPAEENVESISTEKDSESLKEIPPEQTSTNSPQAPSSFQSDMSQHQSSSENSPNVAIVPSLPPSFVVLKDVMSQMPENEKLKYSLDVSQKKLKNGMKVKKISKKSVPQSHRLQKSQIKDSGNSTSRKVLNKIDNTGSAHRYVRSFRCKSCPFQTGYSEALKRHFLAKHEKIRNHKCNQCSYAAKLKQHLVRHIADIHEKGELKFRCTLCPYKSSSNSNLKRHFENIHEKKKPFKCDLCDFESAHKVCMLKHIVGIHERTRPFLCDFCTYRCSAKDNLRRHVYLRHGLK